MLFVFLRKSRSSLPVASSRRAFFLDLSLVLKQQRWTLYAIFPYLS
nr:MAG TPA: hypothetical protein [Caudoviricetes sp.]